MSDPSDSYLCNILHTGYMFRGVSDLVNDLGINAVEKSCEQGFAGVPPDFEDDQGNQKANERIGHGETKPHAECPDEDGQTPQPIHPGMLPFRHEGRAADLSPDFDPEDSHGFVAKKAYHGCYNHCPQMLDRVRREES